MEIGQLRHRVTFQSASLTQNDYGEPVPTYSEVDTVWARIEPIAGSEKYAAMHHQGETDHRVLVRYNSALAALAVDDRVKFGSRYFDIKSIKNTEERDIQLEIFCKERI